MKRNILFYRLYFWTLVLLTLVFGFIGLNTASADMIPAGEFCDSYLSIPGVSGASVTTNGDECDLVIEGKNSGLSVRAQITDFTDDQAAANAKYAEYKMGIDGMLAACDGATHPCNIKTNKNGSLVTHVITYNIPEEKSDLFIFRWGAGEVTSTADLYRGYPYAVFTVQSDSDGEVDNPGIYSSVIAKTKKIIDTRIGSKSDSDIAQNSDDSSKKEEADGEETEKTLKVLSVSEDVEIRKEGGGWEDANTNMRLEDGDEISTGPDSIITLQFPDGTIMQVSELTQVRVGFLLSEGNAVRAEIQLKIGKVAAKVNPKKTSFTDFTIKSPIATASVRGTIFGVIYHDNTGMRVMVEEGSVEVTTNDGKSQKVSAGYDMRVTDEGFGEQYVFDDKLFEGEFTVSENDDISDRASGGFNPIILIIVLLIASGLAFVLLKRRGQE
ncbi:MAG: FecR family protein [bacterium]|nr:FecR family protein [bacterium]